MKQVVSLVMVFSFSSLLFSVNGAAADPTNHNTQVNRELAPAMKWPGVIRSDIGVTRRQTRIACLITADDLDYGTKKTRILLVGGLAGDEASVKATWAALTWFYTDDAAKPFRQRYAVSAVPIANPDGWAAGKTGTNLVGGKPDRGYPPKGSAYNSPTDPEAAYLWRWTGMHAPDLVVRVEPGEKRGWLVPTSAHQSLNKLVRALPSVSKIETTDRLVSQLAISKPSNTGTIPAMAAQVSVSQTKDFLQTLLEAMDRAQFTGPSPARRALQRRLSRSPVEVAHQLARRYGHNLNSVAYIPALALIGRLRLGELTGDRSHLADVERIVAPYFKGDRPSLPKRVSGSNLSGHLIFTELARATGKKRYIELAQAAADLGFDEQGRPKPSMPFHNEMSDSVFMGCPILVQVGRLTGDRKYYDMALRHLRFMLKLNLRQDGLHRHSPLDKAAWGRGNGFPALGLALCLTELPKDDPVRGEMLDAFRSHLEALIPHQDPTGAWHQVVDHSGSYREFTSTAMITFAMIRGVRRGWLDHKQYAPVIERSWNAILTRIAPDATLVDVCTGTGKQKNLQAYFDRTAILGPDARGGAMALMVTTEMAQWQSETR